VKDSLGEVTVTLINKDTIHTYDVKLTLSGKPSFSYCKVIRLTAPSVNATSDYALGGDIVKNDGTWIPKNIEKVNSESNNSFNISVSAGSAASVHLHLSER